MRKYYFEADRTQWEKPTEPKYRFCATAKTFAYGETEDEARVKAEEKLHRAYAGTGIRLLGQLRLVSSVDLPMDWNYGYGDERKTGTPEERAALARECTR